MNKERQRQEAKLDKDLDQAWKNVYAVFPNYNGGGAPHEDILNIRIYDLKFNIEWALRYVQRLNATWAAIQMPDVETLRLIKQDFLVSLRTLKLLLSLIRVVRRMEEVLPKNEINAAKQIMFQRHIWSSLPDLESSLRSIRAVLSFLMNELHSRSEGQEVITETEPYIRFGEKAGVLDAVCVAIHHLFAEYCGKAASGDISRQWNGLVSLTAGTDFRLQQRYQLLLLPMHLHCHIYDKLLPLAHEAGHFVFSAAQGKEALDASLQEFWTNLFTESISEFNRTMVNLQDFSRIRKKRPSIKVFDFQIASEKTRRHMIDQSRYSTYSSCEVLNDLFAGFVGGPGYFCSLTRLSFRPDFCADTSNSHPLPWMRLYLGLELSKHKNWGPEEWGLPGLMDDLIRHQPSIPWERMFLENPVDSLTDDWWKVEIERYAVSNPERFYLFNPYTYLIKALLKKKELFEMLEGWIRESRGSLFFDSDPKEANSLCKDISRRICCENEIVIDRPLKYIAAASILPPLERPYYPSGRIIHSLYYGGKNRNP